MTCHGSQQVDLEFKYFLKQNSTDDFIFFKIFYKMCEEKKFPQEGKNAPLEADQKVLGYPWSVLHI